VTTIAHFDIELIRYLDPQGEVAQPLPAFATDAHDLIPMYRAMALTRAFDAKAVALQRTGRLGTYASALGQEAVGVGLAAAMAPDDILLPSFREQAAQLWRGVGMVDILLYWGGDEQGLSSPHFGHDFPNCVPVGSQAPHAAGVGLAIKLKGEKRAAVVVFGDGATSKGDVYEAMNLGGLWHLPVVFVVVNNGWAISVPRTGQTAAETLAQKAVAAGFIGEQVDGNDVVAVRQAMAEALEAARAGQGPRLIEALTYRLTDHTTADDASRYRADTEVSAHWAEDPLLRLRRHLERQGAWDKGDEEAMRAELAAAVDAAAAQYLATPPQPAASIFDHLYAAPPAELLRQRAAMLAEGGDHG